MVLAAQRLLQATQQTLWSQIKQMPESLLQPKATSPIKLFIAGHQGMVGQALLRYFSTFSTDEFQLIVRSKAELDLSRQAEVENFFATEQPDWVILAAAKVGGIVANQQAPADFLMQNLQIQTNVLAAAHQFATTRLLVLGSSCIYPKMANQPITERQLLQGALEPTNEAYAVAKIAGLKLAAAYQRQYQLDFRALMPTNLYGPGDNFHPLHSHVIPGLLWRLHQAAQQSLPVVSIWGTGQPLREFLHVDDLARCCHQVMALDSATYWHTTNSSGGFLNVGSGDELSIAQLVQLLVKIVGYKGAVEFDSTKPDGTPRKILDSKLLFSVTTWRPQISLEVGLTSTYQWLLANQQSLRLGN